MVNIACATLSRAIPISTMASISFVRRLLFRGFGWYQPYCQPKDVFLIIILEGEEGYLGKSFRFGDGFCSRASLTNASICFLINNLANTAFCLEAIGVIRVERWGSKEPLRTTSEKHCAV